MQALERVRRQAAIESQQEVLTFQIFGFKTERDGVEMQSNGADDIKVYMGPKSISETIEHILTTYGMDRSHVISITPIQQLQAVRDGVRLARDIGSMTFWMFCRNPNADGEASRTARRLGVS